MRRQTMTMKTTTKNNHIVFFSSLAQISSRTMASLFFPSSFAMSMARLLLLPIVAAEGSRGCGWFRVDTIFFGSTFRTVIASLFPLNFFRLLSFTMAFPHRCDVSFLLLDVSRVAPFLPFFFSLCVLNYVWDTYVKLNKSQKKLPSGIFKITPNTTGTRNGNAKTDETKKKTIGSCNTTGK